LHVINHFHRNIMEIIHYHLIMKNINNFDIIINNFLNSFYFLDHNVMLLDNYLYMLQFKYMVKFMVQELGLLAHYIHYFSKRNYTMVLQLIHMKLVHT